MSASVAAEVAALIGDRTPGHERPWLLAGRSVPVVFPGSVDELARVLARASEEGWAVVPAGAGSWLDGGGAPSAPDLVISTREMAGVLEYEPGDLTLTAEAGLTLRSLEQKTAANGQWLPQDPPGGPAGTLGALVSTGLPGPLIAGFGRPRDHVLGLTLVTGDGRIVRPGGKVVKNVAGFDLVRLLCGSWGTLGVVAGVTVRLFPLPERDATLVFRGSTPEQLVPLARSLATAEVVADALELRDPAPPSTGGGERVILARLVGTALEVEERRRILEEAAGRQSDDRLEGDASRRVHLECAHAHAPGHTSLRLTLLPDRLADLLEVGDEIRSRAQAEGIGCTISAHVTRATLLVELDGADEGWAGMFQRIREALEAEGGSLFLVRAPLSLTTAVGTAGPVDPAVRTLVDGLKARFDPAGILAPGRPVGRGPRPGGGSPS